MKSRTLRRRTLRGAHFAAAALMTFVIYVVLVQFLPVYKMTRSQLVDVLMAYSSLGAILATLAIGPLRVLRRRPNPVSSNVRRDFGIWAALTGVAHVGLSLTHHFGGNVALYFFAAGHVALASVRRDGFGAGVWSGALATVVLVTLGAISNDRSIRWLGRRWKTVQRLNYFLIAIAMVHTVIFWKLLTRDPNTWSTTVAAAGVVGALQLAGFVARRTRSRT
jgi:sulfoxide reductase heme-binding subunit YedZ